MEQPRHLFVDGYNILYAWQWLAPRGGTAARVETARARLVETLRALRDVDQLTLTLVFDGRGAAPSTDPAATEPGLSVVYSPADRTADSVIEALVASAGDPCKCIVATADRLERETVSAAGASCISPEDLQTWCERSRARASQSLARRAEKSQATWGNKLPL